VGRDLLKMVGIIGKMANTIYKMNSHLHLRHVIKSKGTNIKHGSRRICRDKRKPLAGNFGNNPLT